MNTDVSRETTQRLQDYESLIKRWNPRINLIAPSTVDAIRQRHIDDSLQIARHAMPRSGLWVDLGSGGGLPGIVTAIACSDAPVKFVFVESDKRKSAFLRTAIRELDLPQVSVISARIEDIEPLNATYISVRALAPMPRLMPYLVQHLGDDGQAWLMKGKQWQGELEEARRHWKFDAKVYPSTTEFGAAILKISGVSHD